MNSKRRPGGPRKRRLPWMIQDLLTPLPGTGVRFTEVGVQAVLGGCVNWSLEWSSIRRIGWLTESTGIAITDDRFLVLQGPQKVFLLADGARGVEALAGEIERRFQPSYGPLGTLANRTDNASVVIWPEGEAGQDLWSLCEQDFGKQVPVEYLTSHS